MLISVTNNGKVIEATVTVPDELRDDFSKTTGELTSSGCPMDHDRINKAISELPESPLKEFLTDFYGKAGTSDTFLFV